MPLLSKITKTSNFPATWGKFGSYNKSRDNLICVVNFHAVSWIFNRLILFISDVILRANIAYVKCHDVIVLLHLL